MAPQSALFVCERDKHDKGAIILQLKKKNCLKKANVSFWQLKYIISLAEHCPQWKTT